MCFDRCGLVAFRSSLQSLAGLEAVAPVSFDRLAIVSCVILSYEGLRKVPVSGDRLTLITQEAPVSFDRLATVFLNRRLASQGGGLLHPGQQPVTVVSAFVAPGLSRPQVWRQGDSVGVHT